MKSTGLPEGFIPLITVGEKDGYLMIFTVEDHDYTIELLETAAEELRGTERDQGMTLQ